MGKIGHGSEKVSHDHRVFSRCSVPCRQVSLYACISHIHLSLSLIGECISHIHLSLSLIGECISHIHLSLSLIGECINHMQLCLSLIGECISYIYVIFMDIIPNTVNIGHIDTCQIIAIGIHFRPHTSQIMSKQCIYPPYMSVYP